ncbi:MAG: Npt1/Npt2 family nucleotide transporter [Woeseia sp.]
MTNEAEIHTEYSKFERVLRLFADVQPREGLTCLILIGNIFLVLAAFYLIKPVREGWLAVTDISGFTKLEVKAYSAFAQSVMLFAILPTYARFAARWPRRVLINRVGGAFAVVLVAFWLSQPGMLLGNTPVFGILFYLFVGIFSVTLVAQFWAFTTDLYGAERGARLFPVVAIGAALGSTIGSWLGQQLVKLPTVEAFDLILVSLIPLGLALVLASWADRRGTYGDPSSWTTDRWEQPAAPAPASEGPFSLILRHRYLTATAAMIMVFTWVVTSGDNILFGIVQQKLGDDLAHLSADPVAFGVAMREATTVFYSDLYFWINLITLLLQAFVVSRILSAGGMQALLYATPFISLAAYASMVFVPILGLIKILKVAENSSTYSIHNTARQMLWLPTTKEMLYQAKPTIDTLCVRLGDGLAAVTILVGTRFFELSITGFVIVNILLVLVWISISVYLQREHGRWTKTAAVPPPRSLPTPE